MIDAGDVVLIGRNVTVQDLETLRRNYNKVGEYRDDGKISATDYPEVYRREVTAGGKK